MPSAVAMLGTLESGFMASRAGSVVPILAFSIWPSMPRAMAQATTQDAIEGVLGVDGEGALEVLVGAGGCEDELEGEGDAIDGIGVDGGGGMGAGAETQQAGEDEDDAGVQLGVQGRGVVLVVLLEADVQLGQGVGEGAAALEAALEEEAADAGHVGAGGCGGVAGGCVSGEGALAGVGAVGEDAGVQAVWRAGHFLCHGGLHRGVAAAGNHDEIGARQAGGVDDGLVQFARVHPDAFDMFGQDCWIDAHFGQVSDQ